MATKIEKIGNYIVLTDTITSDSYEYPARDIRYRDDGSNIRITIINQPDDFGDNINTHIFVWTDLVDSTGTVFASLSALLLWLRSNTGVATTEIKGQNPHSTDAFGRVRVSEITTLLDVKQIQGNSDLFIDKVNIGGGTSVYSSSGASTQLQVTTTSDKVVHQTKQRFNYQSGKSQLIMQTMYNFEPETDVTKRIGYFSSSTTTPFSATLDGLFLQSDNNGISINVYKSGTAIESTTTFNGEDIHDIDWSMNQILFVDFEWLGLGLVRWGLVRNGIIVYFHNSRHDNVIEGTYMSSPNQPLRWEISSEGGAGTMTYVCASVNSEGSTNKVGKILSANNGTAFVNANVIGTQYAILGIRLNSDHLDAYVDVLNFTIMGVTNDNVLYSLYLNPTVAGTFTYNAITESSADVATGAAAGTNTVTGGVLLDSGYISAGSTKDVSLDNAIKLGASIAGVQDTIVLCVNPLSVNLDIYGSITWRELS